MSWTKETASSFTWAKDSTTDSSWTLETPGSFTWTKDSVTGSTWADDDITSRSPWGKSDGSYVDRVYETEDGQILQTEDGESLELE